MPIRISARSLGPLQNAATGVPTLGIMIQPLTSQSFICCRFHWHWPGQDRQVVGPTYDRLASDSESPLLVQARRIALGDRTPVVFANLGSDRYHPGSLVLVRGSKHTWLGIQRRKRRALVRMESGHSGYQCQWQLEASGPFWSSAGDNSLVYEFRLALVL
jgi:hypothetical protein